MKNSFNLRDTLSIAFLSKQEGQVSILDESLELYFSQLQEREIHVFTGVKPPMNNMDSIRDFARSKFSSAVISFSTEEKACILYVIKEITYVLNKNNLGLISKYPWKFIKIENWLCGGFAHTRGNCIIISQKHLDLLTTNWSTNMSKNDQKSLVNKFGQLLIHEQFHCLQRTRKDIFEILYRESWGFRKVKVLDENFIILNQLSNPDAPIPEWAYYLNGEYYWVRTLIKENIERPKMGADFIDLVFILNHRSDKFYIKRDELGDLVKFPLVEFSPYINRFPVKRGLDHPNEISAYMFSSYVISLLNDSIPFVNVSVKAKANTQKFIHWTKNYLN